MLLSGGQWSRGGLQRQHGLHRGAGAPHGGRGVPGCLQVRRLGLRGLRVSEGTEGAFDQWMGGEVGGGVFSLSHTSLGWNQTGPGLILWSGTRLDQVWSGSGLDHLSSLKTSVAGV